MAPTIPWQLFVSVGLEILSRPERDFFSLILITHGVFQILSEGTADWMCMMDREEKLLDFKNKTKKNSYMVENFSHNKQEYTSNSKKNYSSTF